jgi:hypothetical protein
VADVYLADRAKLSEASTPEPRTTPGLYRSKVTGVAVTVGNGNDRNALGGRMWAFATGGATAKDQYGSVEEYERESPATPSAADLASYAGTYVSDDAETELRAVVENGSLVLKRRPDAAITLSPTYKDAFTAPGLGTVIFRRDASGRPAELSVVQERVWDLRFHLRR